MPRYRGKKSARRALGAYVKLVRAAESVTTRVHPGLREAGLTVGQFGVLEALYHLGPMNQAELARKILKTGGNMTMIVDNLERRGLARRERDENDRRVVNVYLTDSGEELIGSIFPGHAATIAAEMGALTADELDELSRLCRKLGRSNVDAAADERGNHED